MGKLPESADGVTLAAVLMVAGAAIGSAIGQGNMAPIAAVCDVIAEVRRALDGERRSQTDQRH